MCGRCSACRRFGEVEMSTVILRGDAPAVAQVNTLTPGSVSVSDTFTMTINGKGITYTAAVATVADVTAGLADALTNSTIGEFKELTGADGTTVFTLTASKPGVPFTQTSSSVGGTLSTSTTTANSGPNNWDVAANWSTGSVP